MGNVPNITATKFPKQSDLVGKPAKLMFHYSEPTIPATIVRDDVEHPFIMIFKTEDDRFILSGECQYSY